MNEHDLNIFVALVDVMRANQRIFFAKTSTGQQKREAMLRAISLERDVDRRIKQWRDEQTQPRLKGMPDA